MKAKTKFFVSLALLFITACSANTYNHIETGGTERAEARLDETRPVLVITPKDGGIAGKITKGSGVDAARIIDASFSREARIVDVYTADYHSFDELKDTIAKNDYGYIVVPTLTQWSQSEKGLFKSANQVRMKIIILDAATGQELSATFLDAHGPSPSSLSSLFTTTLSPPELLSKITDDYVDDLYGILISFN